MGNLNKAIADYEKALKLDPDSVTAYYSRGITRYDKWDLDGALADYNKAIHLRPNYAMAYYGRASIAALKENHTEAIKDF